MKKLFLLALFALLALLAYCQMDHTTLVELFFTEYRALGPEKALEHLYASSLVPERGRTSFSERRTELRQLTPLYIGNYRDYHLLATRSAGPYLVSHSYLVRYEQRPARFTFTFYKANDRWGLYEFSIDTDLVKELNATLKLDYPVLEAPKQP